MYCCSTNLRITSIPPVAQKYSMPSPTTRVRLFWSATIRVRSRRSIRNGCSSCPTAPKITGVRNTRSSSSSRNGAGRGKPNTRARQCLPCFQIERPCVETYRVCVAESSLYFELRAAVALLSPARGRVEHTVLVLRIDVHLLRAVSSDGAWVSRNSGWCVSLDQRRPLREISDGGTRWCGSAARAEHRATVHAHCSRGIPTVVVCVTQFKLGCALTVGCPPQPNEPHGREHEPLQGVGEVRSLVERGAGRGLRHGRCGTGGGCISTSPEPARPTRDNRRGGVAACAIGLWDEETVGPGVTGCPAAGRRNPLGEFCQIYCCQFRAHRGAPRNPAFCALQSCCDLDAARRRRCDGAGAPLRVRCDPSSIDHEHRVVVKAERGNHLKTIITAQRTVTNDNLLGGEVFAGERDNLPTVDSSEARERWQHLADRHGR